jgi:hypothetical protein
MELSVYQFISGLSIFFVPEIPADGSWNNKKPLSMGERFFCGLVYASSMINLRSAFDEIGKNDHIH